ncbi:MAG TPA: SCO family protein [Solirubrobacteraceae bacterium]
MSRPATVLRSARRLLLVVLASSGVALLAIGCGTSKTTTASNPVKFAAEGVLTPAQVAPALSLRNYLGEQVDISSYKGKAVLVTFLYTHCPDVCPLIASNLRVAQNLMGPAIAAKAQIIIVSVDPRGDTRKAITTFLARHEMTGRTKYLVGSAHELAAVWKAWGVGSERDAKEPQFVNHSGLIYGITASGKRLTLYASNFKPSDIAHDVPLLAAR